MGTDSIISISSLVSNRTGEPLVELEWGSNRGQMSPKMARDHAMAVLEAAVVAETDAFLVSFLGGALHLPREQISMVLMDFRKWRVEGAHMPTRRHATPVQNGAEGPGSGQEGA